MSDTNETSGLGQFWAEMRRRHVVRFALAYAAAAFVILQLAEIVFPAFNIGENGLRVLVAVAALGFPPALVLAWVYDLTKEGIKRTEGGIANPLLQRVSIAALLITTIGATGALGLYLARQGVFESAAMEPGFGQGVQPVSYDPNEPIDALAVLPLDDFSPTGDQAYFTSGMHEELIAKLSQLEEIRVVSRTTVMQYAGTTMTMPQIGRELGVDVVIEGSVSRTPERTRVTLQLIHAPSDSHIETLQWDREEVSDVLAFQSEIAHDVVMEVVTQYDETTFVQTAANVEPAAQDAYFRGKYEFDRGTPEGLQMALDYFEEAIAEDPEFAAAMAGAAGARFLMGIGSPDGLSEDEIMQARDDARMALMMDSTSVEALDVLALIERSVPRVMEAEPLIPAPEAEPKSVHIFTAPGESESFEVDMVMFDTAWVAASTTLGERIEEQVRRATTMAGREAASRPALEARQLWTSGRYAEAAQVLETVVEFTPQSAQAWDMLARSHMARGDVRAAEQAIIAWHETGAPGAPTEADVSELGLAIEVSGARGYWAWRLDELEERDAANGPRVPRMEFASTHAALGNDDEAIEYLIQAFRAGEPGIMTVRTDPVWDHLRSNERLREIGRQAQQMRFAPTRRNSDREGFLNRPGGDRQPPRGRGNRGRGN